MTALIIFLVIVGSPKKIILGELANSAVVLGNAKISENPNPYYDVNISADGKETTVRTSGTVSDALDAAKVKLAGDDFTDKKEDTLLSDDLNIKVIRVETKQESEVIPLPFSTVYKEDNEKPLGYSEVLIEGKNGETTNVFEYTYNNGVLVDTETISSETVEPVSEVISEGTLEVNPIEEDSISTFTAPLDMVIDENNVPLEYAEKLTGKSCAYTADEGDLMSTGKEVEVGYVAVNPDVIPYGTEMFIVSSDKKYVYGYAIAADTGWSLSQNHIIVDLFMSSESKCVNWGVKQVDIYILD